MLLALQHGTTTGVCLMCMQEEGLSSARTAPKPSGMLLSWSSMWSGTTAVSRSAGSGWAGPLVHDSQTTISA